MLDPPVENSDEKTGPQRDELGRLSGGNPGNSGGKKGRSGRKPDAFRRICQQLASKKDTLQAAQRILKDDKHPAWLGALKWATENGYGKAKESVEITGKDGGPITVCWQFGNGREIKY